MGSGTTGQVAREEGRSFIGIELNPDYLRLAEQRIGVASPLPPRSSLPSSPNFEPHIQVVPYQIPLLDAA
jgi:DNA modification methylase